MGQNPGSESLIVLERRQHLGIKRPVGLIGHLRGGNHQ
jgi:hypothetical protein